MIVVVVNITTHKCVVGLVIFKMFSKLLIVKRYAVKRVSVLSRIDLKIGGGKKGIYKVMNVRSERQIQSPKLKSYQNYSRCFL